MPHIRKKDNRSFFQRIATKYKVSVMSESTLEEVYKLRLSALGLILSITVGTLITLALFSLLILFTPLKGFLPENVDSEVKSQVTEQALQIDSLTEVVSIQNEYLEVLKQIIGGDLILDTTDINTGNILRERREQLLLEKSEAEKEFAKAFEEDEMYNLSIPDKSKEGISFFRPAKGIITQQFNTANGLNGIDIVTSTDATVSAVQSGIVLQTNFDYVNGYSLQITHDEGYVSTYRGMDKLLVKEGDNVSKGEAIGSFHTTDKDKKPVLHFELWNGTVPQNPQLLIVFE